MKFCELDPSRRACGEAVLSGNPELHTLIRLATVLGVDVGELLVGIKGDALPEKRRVFTAKEFVRERTLRS